MGQVRMESLTLTLDWILFLSLRTRPWTFSTKIVLPWPREIPWYRHLRVASVLLRVRKKKTERFNINQHSSPVHASLGVLCPFPRGMWVSLARSALPWYWDGATHGFNKFGAFQAAGKGPRASRPSLGPAKRKLWLTGWLRTGRLPWCIIRELKQHEHHHSLPISR